MNAEQSHAPSSADHGARRWSWIGFVGSAAFLWCVLVVTFLLFVPVMKRKFDEFGLKLPMATELVIDVSMWAADYWWCVIPGVVPFALILGFLTYLVRVHVRSLLLRMVWTFFLIGVPVLCLIFVWLSLWLPWLKLQEGLRK